jgi:hypothetical protein
MKLVDLRRLAIKKQLKIHFKLRNGMECIVTEEGIATVPALKAIPDFDLEDELTAAGEFLVEAAAPAPPRNTTRGEMMSLTSASPAAAAQHDHDDE